MKEQPDGLFETTRTSFASYRFFAVYAQERRGIRKTLDYDVISSHGDRLGTIEYESGWRQHVLVPAEGSIWSSDCLADVANALAKIKGGE